MAFWKGDGEDVTPVLSLTARWTVGSWPTQVTQSGFAQEKALPDPAEHECHGDTQRETSAVRGSGAQELLGPEIGICAACLQVVTAAHGLSRDNGGHVTEPITSHLMAARRAVIVYKTQRDQR